MISRGMQFRGVGHEENSPKRWKGNNIIPFFDDDLGVQTSHDDTFVILMIISKI